MKQERLDSRSLHSVCMAKQSFLKMDGMNCEITCLPDNLAHVLQAALSVLKIAGHSKDEQSEVPLHKSPNTQ